MDVPVPFSPALEDLTVPTAERSPATARSLCSPPERVRGEEPMGLKTFGLSGRRLGAARRHGAAAHPAPRARQAVAPPSRSSARLLCFDMNNIRYLTATHIGTWAIDKLARFTLLPQGDEPILWDFGSAARHHQLYCPWLGERFAARHLDAARRARPEVGQAQDVARKVRLELEQRGLLGETDRRRRDRAVPSCSPAGRGNHGPGRPAADAARRAVIQDRGRDHAAEQPRA